MPRSAPGSGSVFYDSSRDRWVAQLRWSERGRSRTAKRTAETKREAVHLLDQLKAGRNLPKGDGDSPRLIELVDGWIDRHATTVEASTAANYRTATRHLASIGGFYADEVTPADVEEVYAAMAAEGLSARYMRLVRSIVDRAYREDLPEATNPARAAKLPKPRTSQETERRAFTKSELRRLLSAAGEFRLGAMLSVGLLTGMRPGEVRALHWDDIDLDGGSAVVRYTMGDEPMNSSDPTSAKAATVVSESAATAALGPTVTRLDEPNNAYKSSGTVAA